MSIEVVTSEKFEDWETCPYCKGSDVRSLEDGTKKCFQCKQIIQPFLQGSYTVSGTIDSMTWYDNTIFNTPFIATSGYYVCSSSAGFVPVYGNIKVNEKGEAVIAGDLYVPK
jgi:hypothetical protein